MANSLITKFKQGLSLYRTNKLVVLMRYAQHTKYEVRLYPDKRVAISNLGSLTQHSKMLLDMILGQQQQIEANRFGLCFTAILDVPNNSEQYELLDLLKR